MANNSCIYTGRVQAQQHIKLYRNEGGMGQQFDWHWMGQQGRLTGTGKVWRTG